MTGRRATLRLGPAVVRREFVDGNIARHPESHFLELIVDDRSLRSLVEHPAQLLVTELNRPWLSNAPEALEKLLGRRPDRFLAPGRVPLLVCAMCGDLGCGQLTTALDVQGDEVTWSDFRWEDDHSDSSPEKHLSEFLVFDRGQYEAAFTDACELVASFPYDDLAHRGHRFLWPWQWGWRPSG